MKLSPGTQSTISAAASNVVLASLISFAYLSTLTSEQLTSATDYTANYSEPLDKEISTERQTYHNNDNDPFAFTFEDYLKEASKSSAHTHHADSAGLIIEDEDNSIKPAKESATVDYILQETEQQNELLDEIKLLFAWKKLATNKCSKVCGKGHRVNHVYCIDLKYDVRVEDELCQKLPKPEEIRQDEPCNEMDCPPQDEPFVEVGSWSECSGAPCGQLGKRTRNLSCRLYLSRSSKFAELPQSSCHELPHHEEPCYMDCIPASSIIRANSNNQDRAECNILSGQYLAPSIDSDPNQSYQFTQEEALQDRKSVTIKIGGSAQVPEGKNLKIRCKVINRDKQISVEWRKDGLKIFSNHSKVADKQLFPDDNSISANYMYADESNQFIARSWDNRHQSTSHGSRFNFVPRVGGRFSLVQKNTLRIKSLRSDDSGIYSCSHGPLTEWLDLKVMSRPYDSS